VRPAKRDINPDARSHEGRYGDFAVAWLDGFESGGWAVVCDDGAVHGPFHTSQAAFGAAKDAIDQLIAEGK
jgi:hypothetical protein